MDRKAHWEKVYTEKTATQVSWYEPELRVSLELLRATGVGPEARIIDVGGGASTLVDSLVTSGFQRITVLDIAPQALASARQRLGISGRDIQWLEADITQARFAQPFDVWHDRAVFHFLTDPGDRQNYIEQVKHSVVPGGYLIMGTFGPEGPQRCSDLDVARYCPESLHDEFGPSFVLIQFRLDTHMTPWGKPQQFVYCSFRHEPG